MTLQLLICTLDDRIQSVPQLLIEPVPGISYLVSWQHRDGYVPCELPQALKRHDVEVAIIDGKGLSRNRNNCLKMATGDICLIADDDCLYTRERLQSVIDTFTAHPDVAIATFKAQNDVAPKVYPGYSFSLAQPARKYYVTSFEIAFRRSMMPAGLRFDENFGLGSGVFDCGEESVFIHDALRAGLSCRFFPTVVVEHLGPTTQSTHAADPGVLMARGAYIYKAHRRSVIFRALAVAWRLRRAKGIPFNYALEYTIKGFSKMQEIESRSKRH